MYDLVIRGGTVVDGTGAPRRTADVAITGDQIVDVGSNLGEGRREIEADGLLVAPGFVDIHTHYDGQLFWDSSLSASAAHGVTTVVFGNCGVGFAPVREDAISTLIGLMEGVEDIPGPVMYAGVPFDWRTFPEYLDAIERRPLAVDVGAQVPHGALRAFVMGERGFDHTEVATEAECAAMGSLVEEALLAGALGVSTSRTTKHAALDGRPTPGLSAGEPELLAIASGMRRAARGVFEVNSDFGPGELALMGAFARESGQLTSCLVTQVAGAPDRWRETMSGIRDLRAQGVTVNAQVGSRMVGVLMGLETSVNPFVSSDIWRRELSGLGASDRLARLVNDGSLRAALVASGGSATVMGLSIDLEKVFPLGQSPDYEPDPSTNVRARAAELGRDPYDLALELMMEDGGTGLLIHPLENYCGGDLEVIRTMLMDEVSIVGVGDGGAHVAQICDSSSPTFLLTYWARDRVRGPQLQLEDVVRMQARDTAHAYGLTDRGVLQPGYKADVNVIDYDRLRVTRPSVAHDLPTGARRLVQTAEGYRHTFVSGVEIRANDQATGDLPGRLVRG